MSTKGADDRTTGSSGDQTRRHRLIRHFTQSTTIRTVQDAPTKAATVDPISVLCGLMAGVCQAALFSPFDRALYLSMTHGTAFLSPENFHRPFSGLSQSIGGRAISGSLYFPLEQFFFRTFHSSEEHHGNHYNSRLKNFAAGTAAGAVNAMMLNPLSAIKYKTWSRMGNRGMVQEAWSMLQRGGGGVFFKGLTSTLLRDVTFGGCYTCLRLQLQWAWSLPNEHQWMANLVAAALATVVSGPFNLARNLQYASRSAQPAPSTYQVLEGLVRETRAIEGGHRPRVLFLQNRLRIGWGTARVATGMSFGHWCYDALHGIAHDRELWRV